MNLSVVKKEKNDVTIRAEFDAAQFEEFVQKSYLSNRKKFSVDGFRKGKAPRKMIEMRNGEGVFYDDAINDAFSANYNQIISELNLEPVDRPSLDVEEIGKEKGLVLTIVVTVKPEMELGDYKGMEVKKVTYEVTDEEVENELKLMVERNSRLVTADRSSVDGDSVLIDYSGFLGEEQFEGGTAEKQVLVLGSNQFIPGFEEQLVGKSAGDEVDVNVTFPEDYTSEKLAGQAVIFKVTVHEVKVKELPAIDDEFAKDVSEFDTLEELKVDIKVKQEKAAKAKAEIEQKSIIIDKIIENIDLEIPTAMVESQVDDMINEFNFQLQNQGMNLESYLGYMGKEMKDFREELKEDAEKKVKIRLTIEKIADQENVEVSDADIETEIVKYAEDYKTDVETLKKSLNAENYDYIRKDLKSRKTIDLLAETTSLI